MNYFNPNKKDEFSGSGALFLEVFSADDVMAYLEGKLSNERAQAVKELIENDDRAKRIANDILSKKNAIE